MRGLDSLVEDPSQCVLDSDKSRDMSRQQEDQICVKTTRFENDVNGKGAPEFKFAPLNVTSNGANEDAHEAQIDVETETHSRPTEKTPPVHPREFADSSGIFTAENITEQYRRSVNLANCFGGNTDPTLENHVTTQPTPSLNLGFKEQCMVDVKTPAYTSTPIIQRQNGIMDQNITSDTVSMIMNRIEHLNNGIKAIQRDVIQHMENKLNE